MVRYLCAFLCFFATAALFCAQENIGYLEAAVAKTQEGMERAELLQRLAIAYDEAQQEDKGVSTFIQALKALPVQPRSAMSQEELVFVKEAEQLYLDVAYQKPEHIAEETLVRYTPVLDEYPRFYYLNYYLAVAHANRGNFKDFYERFFQSYRYYPKEHIAYRSLAILHLRLWEKAANPTERENERKEVVACLEKAIEKNPRDASLYKFLVILAEEKKGYEAFKKYFPALLQQNIAIPRSDLSFYLSEAFTYKEYELAQQLINQAHGWYDYSRILLEAQSLLNRIKKESQ